MNVMKLVAAGAVAIVLAGCRYEGFRYEMFPDPKLSARDLELLALAPSYKREFDPYRARYRIKNPTSEPPGTIVINSDARFLYLVEEGGTALRYEIAVGVGEYLWRGKATIRRKAEWPTWAPMSEARRFNPDLPPVVPGGPLNPLGARALYLYDDEGRDTYIRIHGTNEPETIGTSVSLGCVRMNNIDVIDLYNRVGPGTRVVVN